MIAISIDRIAVPSVALVVFGAALAYGITHVRREPPVATKVATSAQAVALAASGARGEGSVARVAVQAEANAVAEAVAVSPRSADGDNSVPVFDIARIEPAGDAVIAGRAAPGAIVELLRNGEPHDRAVADQSGQFVMVPPQLPPGDYELTLRSRQPDGKQATSKQRVAVALAAGESSSGAVRSPAELPFTVPETVATNRSVMRQAARSSEAHLLSGGVAPSAAVGPRIATAVVSRGDSLWRISHVTYGEGMRYAVVYRANRDQIRNPNRIYPGQIFVLPMKAR
jgi:nucleoid-associated protein YgaU